MRFDQNLGTISDTFLSTPSMEERREESAVMGEVDTWSAAITAWTTARATGINSFGFSRDSDKTFVTEMNCEDVGEEFATIEVRIGAIA